MAKIHQDEQENYDLMVFLGGLWPTNTSGSCVAVVLDCVLVSVVVAVVATFVVAALGLSGDIAMSCWLGAAGISWLLVVCTHGWDWPMDVHGCKHQMVG